MVTAVARPRWALAAAIVAVLFGGVTILSGGRALFGGIEARAPLGNIVPFVLWFNFVAGFAYVGAGIGLFLWERWAAHLSAAIAIATVAVFVAFTFHLAAGGAYELRTVGAMVLRTGVWLALALMAYRAMGGLRHQEPSA